MARTQVAQAAAIIRKELKLAFPGVKFSVRSESFSMGNAVRVSWKDGPCGSKIKEVVAEFEAGSFDGMTDSYNYKSDCKGPIAKYISISRDFSDYALAVAKDNMMQHGEKAEEITLYDIRIEAAELDFTA